MFDLSKILIKERNGNVKVLDHTKLPQTVHMPLDTYDDGYNMIKEGKVAIKITNNCY